jgi:hypothetical protein
MPANYLAIVSLMHIHITQFPTSSSTFIMINIRLGSSVMWDKAEDKADKALASFWMVTIEDAITWTVQEAAKKPIIALVPTF